MYSGLHDVTGSEIEAALSGRRLAIAQQRIKDSLSVTLVRRSHSAS